MQSLESRIIIIAGPNGAGKTTFAREFLPREAACAQFINADLIAAGLSPFAPETAAIAAGRLMIEQIRSFVARRESFALETTLSGRGYARQIRQWQQMGYRVELIYLKLRSARLAVARVRTRVAQGGHHIPASIVRRRLRKGWENFSTLYQPLVDHWELHDNSDQESVLIGQGDNS